MLVLAGALAATQLISPSGSTIAVTEAGPSDGVDPFMPSITTQPPTVVPPGDAGGTVSGGTSGLYGGTLNVASCDPARMVAFLASHPDKAAAWAGIQGISPADIPGYVAGLTPVLLRADTAVTNHGFADGAATTLHSVLQAGTAVLVDRYGVARARCACGNPLTPSTVTTPAGYTGDRWAAFDPAHVVTATPTLAPMTKLTLVDPVSLAVFTRPVGSNGTTDQASTSSTTASPSTSLQPAPHPQPSDNGNLPKPAPVLRVPNVIGQDIGTATATLENQGFQVDMNAVDGAGGGTVLSTDPAPGTRVQPGSKITLNVLANKEKKHDNAQVPNVTGHTLSNAVQTLDSAGYTNVAAQGSHDPNGIVVDQQPSGGSSADPATKITLTVQSSTPTTTNGLGGLIGN